MPKYTRVAIVQVALEPFGLADFSLNLDGSLRDATQIALNTLREEMREMSRGLSDVIDARNWAHTKAAFQFCAEPRRDGRAADIVVFPEFSIQRAWLPRLAEMMGRLDEPPVVVAASHLFEPTWCQEYDQLGWEVPTAWIERDENFYVTPVLWKDQGAEATGRIKGKLLPKITHSPHMQRHVPYEKDWDLNLEVIVANETLNLGIFTCSDFLTKTSNYGERSDLFVVPACTPRDTVETRFLPVAKELLRTGNRSPTVIAAAAVKRPFKGGGSRFYASAPREVTSKPSAMQSPHRSFFYQPDSESLAVMIMDLALGTRLFDENTWPSRKVTVAPITESRAFPAYCQLLKELRALPAKERRAVILQTPGRPPGSCDVAKAIEETLRLPDCTGVLREKLTELEAALEYGERGISALRTRSSEDVEALIDAVVVEEYQGSPSEQLGLILEALEGACENFDESLREPLREVIEEGKKIQRELGDSRQVPAVMPDAAAPYAKIPQPNLLTMFALDAISVFATEAHSSANENVAEQLWQLIQIASFRHFDIDVLEALIERYRGLFDHAESLGEVSAEYSQEKAILGLAIPNLYINRPSRVRLVVIATDAIRSLSQTVQEGDRSASESTGRDLMLRSYLPARELLRNWVGAIQLALSEDPNEVLRGIRAAGEVLHRILRIGRPERLLEIARLNDEERSELESSCQRIGESIEGTLPQDLFKLLDDPASEWEILPRVLDQITNLFAVQNDLIVLALMHELDSQPE